MVTQGNIVEREGLPGNSCCLRTVLKRRPEAPCSVGEETFPVFRSSAGADQERNSRDEDRGVEVMNGKDRVESPFVLAWRGAAAILRGLHPGSRLA
jgi:hypothetical protein